MRAAARPMALFTFGTPKSFSAWPPLPEKVYRQVQPAIALMTSVSGRELSIERKAPILSPEDAKIYDFHPDNLHTRGYRQLLYTPGGYILIDQQGRQTRTAAHVLRLLGILTRKSG